MSRSLRSRILGIVGVLAVLAGLAWLLRPLPVEVDLVEVTRGPLIVTVDEDGRTRVRERYVVASPLAGRLQRVTLKSGDPVVADETIVATIEASDATLLDDRARAETEARLKAAEAHRDQAATTIDRAQDAAEVARSTYTRGEQLATRAAITREELDELRLKYQLATHDERSAQFGLKIAEFELAQAQAALTRFTPRDGAPAVLYRQEIRAPITGSVFRVFEESSKVVEAGARLIELGDPADLEVEVDVLSVDAVKIKPGARVLLNHWGGDHPLEARVRIVEPSAFTKISALGIEEQRVWIIADIVTPAAERGSLGDGFRVEASIVTHEETDVIKVPAGTVFRTGEQWTVYRIQGGLARLQPVKVGISNDAETQILEGIEPGDQLVLHPSDRVTPDCRITPRKP